MYHLLPKGHCYPELDSTPEAHINIYQPLSHGSGLTYGYFPYIKCTGIILSQWIPQKELTGLSDWYLVGLPSKTCVSEDKLTGCLSVGLVISFSVGYCSTCCVNKFCVLVQDGAYLDEQDKKCICTHVR